MTRAAAILLVGGRSRRMGGGFKPLIEIGGRTLFARAARALSDAGCAPVIAVGPVLDETASVEWTREDPPFAGPVAGIAAAMKKMPADAEWTLLLAGDLPRAGGVARALLAAVTTTADATEAIVFRAGGHAQWLAGIYRATALRRALAGLNGAAQDASCRALLGDLDIVWLSDDDGITDDIDTPADLARVRVEYEEES